MTPTGMRAVATLPQSASDIPYPKDTYLQALGMIAVPADAE